MSKIVLFDFDGTLADTAPLMRSIYQELTQTHKLKVMTDEDYAALRKGTLNQARRWSGARWWQMPQIIRSVKKLMAAEGETINLFPGVPEMIRELHSRGATLYILSHNAPDTIARTLERYQLRECIQILPRRKWVLSGKAPTILSLLRLTKADPTTVWMVGDEVRDLQAAHRAGVGSIAVSWGLQDESILATYQPTHMVSSIDELHQMLLKI